MELLSSKAELANWIASRKDRKRVLVPTMGALHQGHTSLFDLAGAYADGGDVVATIFVNPTQFGPNEDFTAYPRQLEDDLAKCREQGVTAVFAPSPGEMYLSDSSISIRENQLSRQLCGASRPGHFDGVCTIVAKLFLLTQPSSAIFGEKDFQQLAIIRRLVRDLNFPIDIIPGPTVREKDGLAMSSRNAYLSPEERSQAPIIWKALVQTASAIAEGKITSPAEATKHLREQIETASLARIDYVEIVNASTFESLTAFEDFVPRLLAAVHFGKTRLIDNIGVAGLNEATASGPSS